MADVNIYNNHSEYDRYTNICRHHELHNSVSAFHTSPSLSNFVYDSIFPKPSSDREALLNRRFSGPSIAGLMLCLTRKLSGRRISAGNDSRLLMSCK